MKKSKFEQKAAKLKEVISKRDTKALDQKFSEREKSLIEYLRKEMAKIAQSMQRLTGGGVSRATVLELLSGYSPGGGSGSGGNFTREDLSSQCDGSNKVFTLANSYKTGSLQVMGTQFPIIYRPSTDFTESGDAEVTLTSEVGAPESGQTLVAIYELDA